MEFSRTGRKVWRSDLPRRDRIQNQRMVCSRWEQALEGSMPDQEYLVLIAPKQSLFSRSGISRLQVGVKVYIFPIGNTIDDPSWRCQLLPPLLSRRPRSSELPFALRDARQGCAKPKQHCFAA